MAGMIQCFRDEFLPVHKNDEYVDLFSHVQKFKNFTPIPSQRTKSEESVQNMPTVVIMNFSSDYGEKLKISFPNKGFTALANIDQQNDSDIHTRAQYASPLLNQQDAARYETLKQRREDLTKQLYQLVKADNDV